MPPEATAEKFGKKSPRMRLISDAIALSEQLLRLEAERKAIDPHAALRLAEIVLELYPRETFGGGGTS